MYVCMCVRIYVCVFVYISCRKGKIATGFIYFGFIFFILVLKIECYLQFKGKIEKPICPFSLWVVFFFFLFETDFIYSTLAPNSLCNCVPETDLEPNPFASASQVLGSQMFAHFLNNLFYVYRFLFFSFFNLPVVCTVL